MTLLAELNHEVSLVDGVDLEVERGRKLARYVESPAPQIELAHCLSRLCRASIDHVHSFRRSYFLRLDVHTSWRIGLLEI